MKSASILFCLSFLCPNLSLLSQNWIPRLNKNDTYSLVTEKGELINNEQYGYVQPKWDGLDCVSWVANGVHGCLFKNKVSIISEPKVLISGNCHAFKVKEIGKGTWNDYLYLADYFRNFLIVNTKTGKYVEDVYNAIDFATTRGRGYFPVRNGLMKINKEKGWVNFVNSEFKEVLSNPIYNGEALTSGYFIAQDTASEKFGIVDSSGKEIVPYMYDKMELSRAESHIIVGIEKPKGTDPASYRYGILDIYGNLVLDTIYRDIKVLFNKFYMVNKHFQTEVFDINLTSMLSKDEYIIRDADDVWFNSKCRYLYLLFSPEKNYKLNQIRVLDSLGHVVFQESGAGIYLNKFDNYISVKKDHGEHLVYSIWPEIKLMLRDTFNYLYNQSDYPDLLFTTGLNGGVKVYSREGKMLYSNPSYSSLVKSKAYEGVYFAIKNQLYGIVDTSGEVIAPFEYTAIFEIASEEPGRYYQVFKTDKTTEYGTYDKNAKKWYLFNSKAGIEYFSNSRKFEITYGKNRMWGVKAQNGEMVIPQAYSYIYQVKYAPVFACYDSKNKNWIVIDARDKKVLATVNDGIFIEPAAFILEDSKNLAVVIGNSTLFLEKVAYKKLSLVDLVYNYGLCYKSGEHHDKWVNLYKRENGIIHKKEIWVNYYTGVAYMEK